MRQSSRQLEETMDRYDWMLIAMLVLGILTVGMIDKPEDYNLKMPVQIRAGK